MKNISILFLSLVVLVLSQCAPPPASKGDSAADTSPRISVKRSDTLTYTMEFFNQSEKNDFTRAFKHFIDSYKFSGLSFDSTYNQIAIRIFNAETAQNDAFSTVQKVQFSDDVIEKKNESESRQGTSLPTASQQPQEIMDSIQPVFGGTIRLYSPRSSIDQTLAKFTLPEISRIVSDTGFCTIIDSDPHKIIIKLNDKSINARKRTLTTLDLIQQWTTFVKNNPAEGGALFFGTEGINEFITGKEALIRGLVATDQKTIQVRYTIPQQNAATRLKTPELLVSTLCLGPYYQDNSGSDITLLPDTVTQKRRGYLDKLIIKTGGDPNPVLSFSLNRFDALILNSTNDINYARSTLADKATLHKITSDRYFISCNIPDLGSRAALRSIINPEALMKNYCKIEGNLIHSTASDSVFTQNSPDSKPSRPFTAGTIRILFRKDDAISKNIAEKLLADLSKTGSGCVMAAFDAPGYEKALVSKDYNIAVGWVAESILNNPCEKARYAAMWFDNDSDEEKLIADNREIPLFSVNNYLCTRKNVRLYNGALQGIFITK